MAALTSPPFVVLFTCSWIFVLCQGTQEVKVTAGENATLQCRGHGGAAIIVIKWRRSDLKSDDGYVFYLSGGRSYENFQHESFRGRVELRDPEMKDGDTSVILKNVNINDAGTYECRAREEKETGSPKLISTIKLTVIGTQELKVKPGEDATLQCRGTGAIITVIKWIRPDLESDGYVFFFRDGRLQENEQHPSFRGRVELRDPEMKDGNASVILKNININDAGTYECWIKEEKETGKPKLILTIRLTVTEPGHTAGHKEGGDEDGGDKERNVGLSVGLSVGGILLLLLGVGGFVIFKKCGRPTEKEQPPANEAELQNLQ